MEVRIVHYDIPFLPANSVSHLLEISLQPVVLVGTGLVVRVRIQENDVHETFGGKKNPQECESVGDAMCDMNY